MLKLEPKQARVHEWKSKKRKSKPLDFKVMKQKADKRDEDLPTTVQGKAVESKEEARVAVALGLIQLPFRYRFWAAGSEGIRGSVEVDFLVFTKPMPTPLFVQSTYWHGPGRGRGTVDKLQQARLRRIHTGWADPKEIWDYQIPTVWDAVTELSRMFGRY